MESLLYVLFAIAAPVILVVVGLLAAALYVMRQDSKRVLKHENDWRLR